MEIVHRLEHVGGTVLIENLEIISVSSRKHCAVDLCIKSNMNIPFAAIKLYSSDRYVDAEACFESAEAIGKEIEGRWKLQAEIKNLQKALQKISIFAQNDDSGENIAAILNIIDQECEIND